MNEVNEVIKHLDYMSAILMIVTTVFVVTPIFFGFIFKQTKYKLALIIPLSLSFIAGFINLAFILNWFYFKEVLQVIQIQIFLLAQMIFFIVGVSLVVSELIRDKDSIKINALEDRQSEECSVSSRAKIILTLSVIGVTLLMTWWGKLKRNVKN